MRLRLSAVIAVAAIVASAPRARAQGLEGSFKSSGTSARKGAYTGTVTVKKNGDGSYTLNASLDYKAGGRGAWTGQGKLKGASITFKGNVKGGIVDSFNPFAKKVKWRGTYTVTGDRRQLSGSWTTSDGSSGTETISRDAPPPSSQDLLTLVDGSGTEVPADKKKTEGVVLAPNLDDDDDDGGKGADGDTRIVADKDDPDGVANENDLLPVRLKKPANAPAGATFAFVHGSRIKVWSSKTKAPGTLVESGKAFPATDGEYHVEGLSPSEPGTPEVLRVQLASGGQVTATDEGAVWVARTSFLLLGHGNSGRWALDGWLSGKAADGRKDPVLVRGKDESGKPCAWAAFIWNTEKKAKIALAQPGAVIAYDGHSNFGMGFSFETHFKTVREFLNIADPQVPVNWEYLRDHQEHPTLMFEDSEYADDASTPTFSDPVRVPRTITGAHGTYTTARWPEGGGNGQNYPLTRGSVKWKDHHYGSEDNVRIVVKAGSRDMPTKNWSKIFLNSCYAGQYYYDSFGGKGTLFFTHDEASSSQTSKAFLAGVMEGKSDEAILTELNSYENINDYYKFGN